MTNTKDGKLNYRTIEEKEEVSCASEGDPIQIVGVADVRVKQVIDDKDKVTLLRNVWYAPNCRTNLQSLTKAQSIGVEIVFKSGGSNIVAAYKGKNFIHDDSKKTSITELTETKTT